MCQLYDVGGAANNLQRRNKSHQHVATNPMSPNVSAILLETFRGFGESMEP